jgi:hypothetical protein
MSGGDSGCEIVGDDGRISDAQGDAFCWNRKCEQVVLGVWSPHVFGKCDL